MKKTTRLTAILLALLMIMQTFSFAASVSDFKDFPDDWSTEAMTAAVNNGLLIGTSDDTIEPNKNLTRAEMTAIISRAFGATTMMDISFTKDVSTSDWFYSPVAVSYKMGVFNGTRDDMFSPNESMTRQDVFLGLSRVLLITSPEYSVLDQFSDKSSVDSWALMAVTGMVSTGYLHGYEDGTLRPRGYITRAELAQVFHNIFKTYISEPGTYNTVAPNGSVIVRAPGVTLKDVTINGDLIMGDGIGNGDFNLENVTVNGRIIARGGEGTVTFKNVKCTGKVIINDVNGVVNFHNYRSDVPFKNNLTENTAATFLKEETKVPTPGPSSGGGGGGGAVYYTYKTEYWFQQPDGSYVRDDTKTATGSARSGSVVVAPTLSASEIPGYVENLAHSDRFISSRVYTGLVLKRYYDREKFTVSFVSDGSVVGTREVISGGKVTPPADPSAPTGKYFTGWSTDGTEAGIVDFDVYTVGGDVTLTAVFKDGIGIRFMNGTTVFERLGLKEGDAVNKPSRIPVKAADAQYTYAFSHWSETEGGAEFDFTGYTASVAKDFYAVYTSALNKYEVKFMNGTDQVGSTQNIEYGNYAVAPANPTKAEDANFIYTFSHWSLTRDGEAVSVITNAITGNTTYYAVFSATGKDQTIKFMNGTVEYNVQNKKNGESVTVPANPTKAADAQYTYTFSHWSDTENGAEFNLATYKVNGSKTFYAVYTRTLNKYEVNFMNDTAVVKTQNVDYNGYAVAPANPTKAENENFTYTFSHWSLTDGGASVNVAANPIVGNTVYYAVFTANAKDQTIKFMNGSVEYDVQNKKNGERVTAPSTNPTKDATAQYTYTFSHWSDTVGGTSFNFSTYTVNGSKTFYAVYSETTNYYSVRFFNETLQIGSTQSIAYGGHAAVPANPTKAENANFTYTFSHWSLTDGGEAIDASTNAIRENTVYYAVFTSNAKDQTIKFMNGSVEFDVQNKKNGESVTPPATNPTKTATAQYTYTFKHWSETDGGATAFNFTTYTVNGPKTFYAVYTETVNKYNVRFISDGAQIGTTQSVDYNGFAAAPANPTKAEDAGFTYSFDHWSLTDGGAAVDVSANKITAATDYYAVFTANAKDQAIKFMNGTVQFDIQNKKNGESVTPPSAVPTKEATAKYSYTFSHWSETDGGASFNFAAYTVNGPKTFYAVFTETINKLTVTFMLDDAEYDKKTVDYDTAAGVPATDPTKANTTFEGWYNEQDGKGTKYEGTEKITANTVVYAFMKPVSVTVRFFDEGKDPALQATFVVDYNDSIAESDFPEGYSVDGYKKNGTISSVYNGMDFVHKINYKWLYDDNGTWVEYVAGTPVTEDIDVYLRSKFATLVIDLNKFGLDFVFEIPYEEDTRAGDAIKDALFINEGYVTSAYNASGAEAKLLEKLRSRGIIDPNTKEILNIDRTVNFVTVLGKDNLNKLIDEQLKHYFDGAGRETLTEFLKNYIGNVNSSNVDQVSTNLQSLLNTMLTTKPTETKTLITNAANTIINSDITAFSDFIKEYVDSKVSTPEGKAEITTMLNGAFNDFCDSDETNFKEFVSEIVVDMINSDDQTVIDFVADHVIELIKNGQFQNEIKTQLAAMEVSELKAMIMQLVNNDFDLVSGKIKDKFISDDDFVNEIVDMITSAKVAAFDEKIVQYAKNSLGSGGTDLKDELKERFLAQWNSFDDATKKNWIQDYIDGLTNQQILDIVKSSGTTINSQTLLDLVKSGKVNVSNATLLDYIKNGTVSIPDATLLSYIKNGSITISPATILGGVKDGTISVPDATMLGIVKNAVSNGTISSAEIVDLVKGGQLVLPTDVVDSIIRDRIKQEAIDAGMPESAAQAVADSYTITAGDRTQAIDNVTTDQIDAYIDDVLADLTYDDISGYADDFIANELTADMISSNYNSIVAAVDTSFIASYKSDIISALTESDIAANRTAILNLVTADDIDAVKSEIIGSITTADIAASRTELADMLLGDSDVQESAITAYIDNSFNNTSDVEATIRDLLDTDDGRILLASVIKDYLKDPANAAARADVADSAVSILDGNSSLKNSAVSSYLDKALANTADKNEIITSAVEMLSSNPNVLNNPDVESVVRDAIENAIKSGGTGDDMVDSYIDGIVASRDFSSMINLFTSADKTFRDGVIDKMVNRLNTIPGGKDIIKNMIERMLDAMFDAGSIDISVVKVTVMYMSTHSDSQLIDDIVSTVSQMDNILEFAESLGYDAVNEKLAEVSKFKNQITNNAQFEVNKDNVFIIEPLRDLLVSMTFDYLVDTYLKPRIPAKVLDNLPLDIAEPIYMRSRADYLAQIEAAIAAAGSDSTGYVNSGVTIKFNPVTEVVMPLYDYAMNSYGKLEEAAANHGGQITDKYEQYIKANPYLHPLLDLLDPHMWLTGSDSAATDTHSGYSLKEFTDYYQILKSASVLLDDTFLWYCKNVDFEDVENVLDRFETRILNYTNLLNNIIVDYAANGLPGSLEEILEDVMNNEIAKGDFEIIDGKTDIDLDYYLDRLVNNGTVESVYDKLSDRIGARLAVILQKYAQSKLNKTYTDADYQKGKEILYKLYEDEDANITVDYFFDNIIKGDSKDFEFRGNKGQIERTVK